jgi:uncharacterized protein involved in outer membrane biogenesis
MRENLILAILSIMRRGLYILGGLIAFLLLIIILLAFIRIPIDLSGYKKTVESAASLALGYTVKVDDKIVVSTSLQPLFRLEGLRIENPEGFGGGDFLQMDAARVRIKLLPLLSWKIHIAEIGVEGLSVDLMTNEKGWVNWVTPQAPDGTPGSSAPEKGKPTERPQPELTSDSLVLTRLTLKDISISYQGPETPEPVKFNVDTCTGQMVPGKPFDLSMKGALLNEPFTTKLQIASLKELLETNTSWMDIKTDIAKTRFDFTGKINVGQVITSLQLKASVSGDHLNNLNNLLTLDLPPIESFKAVADLTLKRNRIDLSNLTLQIGESQLNGKMKVDTTGSISTSTIELKAPMIQLNDFDLGEWSPEKIDTEKAAPEKKESESAATDNASANGKKIKNLLSPEVLEAIDLKLTLNADSVVSGKDKLGSGSLTATVKEGRFSVDPVALNIPGGSFFLAGDLNPNPKAPEASFRAKLENFDFGVPVRRINPKADMGGIINLDVDLKSKADSFENLMANGNGYLDFSGSLDNIKAGIIDLWAVNLIAAIVSKEDESEINCVVGRWTLKDGILTPDIFLIDTSKIRICCNGQVDFRKKRISINATSAPKRPEFFSLATPIKIEGSLSDFGIGVQTAGLLGTAVRFLTSPVHVPIRRLIGKELPADGSDVCGIPIGPDNRSNGPPLGCK